MPPDVLRSLLAAIGTELVLVGGQALAFWMDRYGISPFRGALVKSVPFNRLLKY